MLIQSGRDSLNDFRFSTCIGCFQSVDAESMAVKGLRDGAKRKERLRALRVM